ncbi:MAG TPA: DNA-3-methyladenine glycosylase I [Burkholderiales bacterium]|nr:DNA-3-methyladenine glycosylase I [Burkholderiales bacterium]
MGEANNLIVTRCAWVKQDPLYLNYHDREWGVPVHYDRRLFEFLILEGAQAGLKWILILRKREAFRQAYDNFNPVKIARYGEEKINALLADTSIVRNRAKIEGAITNAQAFLAVQEQYGNFDEFIWQFVGGKPIVNHWRSVNQIPSSTVHSDAMSKALRKHGFKFAGTTICYAFMQAVGMVNDHTISCFRHDEVSG